MRRRVILALVVAGATALAVMFPYAVFIVSYADPPHPSRGVGLPEMLGVIIAIVAALSQTDAFDSHALHSPASIGAALSAEAHIGYIAPTIPFLGWYVWIRSVMELDGVPHVGEAAEVAGTLVTYSLAAHTLVLLCGPVWGCVLTISAWCTLVWTQHWWGPGVLGGALATGTQWHINWFALIGVWILTVLLHIKRRGVPLR